MLAMEMEHGTTQEMLELHLFSLAKRRLGSLQLPSWRVQKTKCAKLQWEAPIRKKKEKIILQKLEWQNMTQRHCRISMLGDINILDIAQKYLI